MAYTGKTYKFDREENFEEFVDTLGLPADRVAGFKAYKPSHKLVKDGDSYSHIALSPTGDKELKFQSGVEFVEDLGDISAKTTFTVNGNTVVQVQKFDDGRSLTYKREYSEDKLVVTITSSFWDGTATRYYVAAYGKYCIIFPSELGCGRTWLSAEKAEFFKKFKPDQKIEMNGDKYVFTFNTPRGDKPLTFTSGVEFEDKARDLTVKNTFTVDGNNVTHVMKFDSGLVVTAKKEFSGMKMVEKLTNSLPDEKKGFLLNYKPNQRFDKDGDGYVQTLYLNDVEKTVNFKSGEEFESTLRTVPIKNLYTVDGNTITHVMKFGENGEVVSTVKKEFTGDKMEESITNNKWDGTAKRYYSV
ncbi:uncharacterized protein [Epargyreus clarus]|uniref:uncharacterized protein n=1 Tax=Epargyreus clarus TaxID=520877 RepID=UPI003C2F9129